jgi:hypothetical protein
VLHEASHWKGLLAAGMDAWRNKQFVRGHFGSYICRYFPAGSGFLPITVVRDPVQRVISQFWHMKRADDVGPQFAFVRAPEYTLEDFVDDPAVRGRAGSFQTTHLGFDLSREMSPKEVSAILRQGRHEDERALVRAKDFLRDCAAVGITEDLPAFLEDLSAILKSPFGRDLERARGYAPAQRGIDAQLEARIRRNNEADYELYALARELSRLQRQQRVHHSVSFPGSTDALQPPIDLAEADEVKWSVDQPFFGIGWSDIQSYSGGNDPPHRWTMGDRSSLWVRFQPNRRYCLRISVLRFVSWTQVFSLRVGGRKVRLRRIAKEPQGRGAGIYEGRFVAREGRPVQVEFCVSRALSLRTMREPVRRGLAIRSVQFAEERS